MDVGHSLFVATNSLSLVLALVNALHLAIAVALLWRKLQKELFHLVCFSGSLSTRRDLSVADLGGDQGAIPRPLL